MATDRSTANLPALWLTLMALRKPRGQIARTLIRAGLVLTCDGPERQLALRWRKSRYRLMVAVPDGEEIDWVRQLNGKVIPICTRREAEKRRSAFLLTHPDDSARIVRIGKGGTDG